jgi:hypothetical protein
MPRHFLLITSLCWLQITAAQRSTNLHLITSERNHLPGFPNFHFTLNGQEYKLKNGECLEKKITADSIHVVVEDKRLVKKETVDVHVPVTEADTFVWVRVTWTGNFRNPQYGAEIICKTCYEELKKKCRKTMEE